MLQKNKTTKLKAGNAKFAIIASRYNAEYVDPMLNSAIGVLKQAGAKDIEIIRVPGAFEIPVVASRLAKFSSVSAIICLGVILRGETTHAAHIGEAVTRGLMQIQLDRGIPVIHEVLLLENKQQAEVRCQGRKHNRGTEAAQTALEMAALIKHVENLQDLDVPF